MPRHRVHPDAFTIVEVTIALAIVGVLMVSALYALGHAARLSRHAGADRMGMDLARQLLSEITQGRYEEPDGDPLFGLEFESSATRDGWDDVDDYHGWSSTPPEHKDGTEMTAFAGWTRQVAVTYADPQTLAPSAAVSDTGLKRITVNVISPTGEVSTATAFRSWCSSYEQAPALDTEILTWIGVEIRTPEDGVTAAAGTNLLNPITVGAGGGG